MKPGSEIIEHYQIHHDERTRLSISIGQLEFERTQELLSRYLPPAPAVVFDVGGGPGVYAERLVSLGYRVHEADLVSRHAVAARDIAGVSSAVRADARALPYERESADVVLLLGPLYHLIDREDRLGALKEARRVLRPGGVLFAAGISRYASLVAGLFSGIIDDPEFRSIVDEDLRTGQHRAMPERPEFFTTAYFHIPEELAGEAGEAGFEMELLAAVEGPMWAAPDFDARWKDPERRATLLGFARAVETEPALMGMSPHVMAIARRPFHG